MDYRCVCDGCASSEGGRKVKKAMGGDGVRLYRGASDILGAREKFISWEVTFICRGEFGKLAKLKFITQACSANRGEK